MSNYDWLTNRRRHRKLFIVEGNHEKNDFLKSLLKCFPEVNIDIDDVLIYGTNIYQLYNDIDRAYPEGWREQEIDLPMVVSKKKNWDTLYKNDFTNILIIFDYERHDPNFSEEKIMEMQQYFQDMSGVGQLYLNYPMIESYQHFSKIPDCNFIEKKISVEVQPGFKYKELIRDTQVAKMINIPTKIKAILSERFSFTDTEKCNCCVEEILNICGNEVLIDKIEAILSGHLELKYLKTAKYQITHILKNLYCDDTFFSFMRKNFQYIIAQNILKAYKIQTGNCELENNLESEVFLNLNLDTILNEQNKLSRDTVAGFIWVLNSSIFFIPEYNFKLLNQELGLEK